MEMKESSLVSFESVTIHCLRQITLRNVDHFVLIAYKFVLVNAPNLLS